MNSIRLFRQIVIVYWVVTLPFFAFGGGQGSGGGDPMSAQFARFARQLAIYYKANPYRTSLSFDADEFAARAVAIEDSLKDPEARHLIEFTDEKLHDVNGVEKPAVYELNKPKEDTQIRVNRSAWITFTNEERLINVSQEILGIMGVKDRYQLSLSLIQGRVPTIVAIPVPNEKGYKHPGWRIVGMDPDEFGRITNEDVLLDGGTLGVPNKTTRLAEEMIQNPTDITNTDWFRKITSLAWVEKQRPAYLLLNSPNGNSASVTSFFLMKNGDQISIVAYSLMFTRFNPAFLDPCAQAAESLSAVERLSNCYLDLNFYYSNDSKKSVTIKNLTTEEIASAFSKLLKELSASLLRFYANDNENLESALREYFITDYSPVIHPKTQYETTIRNTAAKAFGLEATYIGPFERVSFWKRTENKDLPSIKLYEATKTLAQKNLVFIDGNTLCSEFKGPKLISREKYRSEVLEKKCTYTRMGLAFPEPLYEVMSAAGFIYDEGQNAWKGL